MSVGRMAATRERRYLARPPIGRPHVQSEPQTTADKPRSWRLAALIAAPVHLAFALRFNWLCDDAYITFRYARHLAEGRGLAFNVGETPPVEGYSNLLWTLVLGAAHAVGLDLEIVSRVLSIGCGLALVALVARAAQKTLGASFVATLAAALFVAASPCLGVWSTSGLETLPFAFVLFGLADRIWGAEERASKLCTIAWAASAVLLRADGFAWAAGIAVVGAVGVWLRGDRVALRTALLALASIAVVTLAHMLWRHGYHGSWLSNTTHAKTGYSPLRLERGEAYVLSIFVAMPLLALVPLAALALRGKPRLDVALSAYAVVGMTIFVSLLVGGDFMAMGRFFAPAVAFEALLVAALIGSLSNAAAAWITTAAIVALSILPSFDVDPLPASLRQRFHFRWNRPDAVSEFEQWRSMKQRAVQWGRIAKAIALYAKPGESMLIDALGVVGYRTELHLYDVYGLVSPEVARRDVEPVRASPGHDMRVEMDFFFPQQPTYVGAVVAPATARPGSLLPPEWRSMPWAHRLRFETHPLKAEDGFKDGLSLYLLRMDWDAPDSPNERR
jgi:arabinofuranosyltransferase